MGLLIFKIWLLLGAILLVRPVHCRELLEVFNMSLYQDADCAELQGLLKTVVKVFTSSVPPSFKTPWTNKVPIEFTGSGFVFDVERKLIITNAHCVEHARTILLRKEGDHDKYEASLLAISIQVDLAILTVKKEKFWSSAVPVQLGQLPRMQQEIDVIGYPIGGDSVSITSGVVSRIDWLTYSQSSENQLCIQVDAAINPGNSGGPAFSRGRLVGVAFQGLPGRIADGVGYIIPVTIVEKLLEDFEAATSAMGFDSRRGWYAPPMVSRLEGNISILKSDEVKDSAIEIAHDGAHLENEIEASDKDSKGVANFSHLNSSRVTTTPSTNVPYVQLRGFARAAFEVQHAESPYIRQALKLPHALSGVIVRYVSNISNLNGVFQNGDIIVAVDGHNISNDGRVKFPGFQPLPFEAIVTLKLVGSHINYTFYRSGERHDVQVISENPSRWCPLVTKASTFISYIMFAGLVFSPYARDSEGMENWDAWLTNVLRQKGRFFEKPEDQVVIMTSILPHSVNIGYSLADVRGQGLLKVNDVEIRNISDVAKAIAGAQTEWLTFLFANDVEIVLPVEEGFEATWEIKKDFRMASVASKDIMQKLNSTLVDKLKPPVNDVPSEKKELNEEFDVESLLEMLLEHLEDS